jgi:hypothetical protein
MTAMFGTRERVKAMKEGVDEKDLPAGKILTEINRDAVKRPTETDRDRPMCACVFPYSSFDFVFRTSSTVNVTMMQT